MRIKKTIIIIICLFSVLGYAQKSEYLVLEKSDTVYGEKIIHNHKGIILKNGTNKIMYNDSLVKGYYKSKYNSYYEKVPSPFGWDFDKPNKMVFIKRLTKDGRIKLYYKSSGSGVTYSVYLFISKSGGELKGLPTGGGFARLKFAKKSTYKQLKPFIEDNNEISVELDSIESTKDAFIKLINKYNKSFE